MFARIVVALFAAFAFAGALGAPTACFNHVTMCARACNNAMCVLRMCGAVLKSQCTCEEIHDVLQMQLHYVTEAVVHARHECFSEAEEEENES